MSRRNPEQPRQTDAEPLSGPLDRVLGYVQALAIVAGVAMLAAYGASRVDAASGSAAALAAFDAETADADPVEASVREVRQPVSLDSDALKEAQHDQSLWSDSRRAAYQESLSISAGMPAGVLSIPRFSLRVPIFDGTGEFELNRGVGHIEGTAFPGMSGNAGIAGHRDGFFRVLKDIEVGDVISVRTRDGDTAYRVEETLIVDPEDVYVLDPTDHASITLVTCYPFYIAGNAPRRFIVRGTRVPAPA